MINQPTKVEESYLSLLEFLMLGKQRLLEIGSNYDLSRMQTISLLMLREPRPMHYLVKSFNCDPSNVTGIVDVMEEKGLVSRTESPSDRRIKIISLKAKGLKVRSAILNKLVTDDTYLLSKLTQEEQDSFIHLVQKINHG